MEDLVAQQSATFEQITRLRVNFKKDGPSRKTSEYLVNKLSALENLWQEFADRHNTILQTGDQQDQYFKDNIFEKAQNYYSNTKLLISTYDPSTEVTVDEGRIKDPSMPATSHSQQPQNNEQSSSLFANFKNNQNSNYRAFSRVLSQIDLDNINEKWELEDLMSSIKSRWEAIDSLHWQMDRLLDGKLDEFSGSQFEFYENQFHKIKKSINQKLAGSISIEKITPKIEIPLFKGEYSSWLNFRGLFEQIIHNNTSLSKIQKLQFLKSKLTGEPAKIIQHLHVSNENYDVCWDLINNRYNNIRLLFSNHMNLFLNQPVITHQSAFLIKKMHDVTLESLNGIHNLGIDTGSWDPFIVHVLCQKLDTETYEGYMHSITDPRKLPVLEDFLLYLERRFLMLESSTQNRTIKGNQLGNKKPTVPAKNNNQQLNKNNFIAQKTRFANASISKYVCTLCHGKHFIFSCEKFLLLTPENRLLTVQQLKLCINCLYDHQGKECKSNKTCKECSLSHNTLLHDAFAKLSTNHITKQIPEVLLSTTLVEVKSKDGSYQTLRALVDAGSQVSLISEKAAQVLGLKRAKSTTNISGIGLKNESTCKGRLVLECRSIYHNFKISINVFILNHLINNLPSHTFDVSDWSYLSQFKLADPQFNVSNGVDLLLGAEVYSEIVMSQVVRSNQRHPTLQQTQFGWILYGQISTAYQCNVIQNSVDDLIKFWQVEDINSEGSSISDHDITELHYQQTAERLPNGKYQVRLPMKPNYESKLGESKPKALAQFHQIEKKMKRQQVFAQKYQDFMSEYLALGHMEPSVPSNHISCYLPHHGVFKSDSSAIRVVFNAASKTSSGYSLNDLMEAGPNLQSDIFIVITQWRSHKIAMVADIEKMYRQIWVHPDDQPLQKIVWRSSKGIQEYQLKVLSYGMKASPFIAMRTLRQLASDEGHHYPLAIHSVSNQFYMDDVLCGGDSLTSAKIMKEQLISLLGLGGFNLRKWLSNEVSLSENKEESNPSPSSSKKNTLEFKDNNRKTLGLRWIPTCDKFIFINATKQSVLKHDTLIKKRTLLSEIAQLYDPIGWLSPLSIRAKLLFQEVWLAKITWDQAIPEQIQTKWNELRNDLNQLQKITLPRWLCTYEQSVIELHGFCDSSELAYAGVIYCKTNVNNQVNITLVAAKTRVVPLRKTHTLPRLELCSAVLLSQLMVKVFKALKTEHNTINMYGWSDSMITLSWIKGDTARWQPFVQNRVIKIIQNMGPECWSYVDTKNNPADCATRGVTLQQLISHHLWWSGPTWLKNQHKYQQLDVSQTDEEKRIPHCMATQTTCNAIIERLMSHSNSFTKVIRVLAWVLHFKNKCLNQNVSLSINSFSLTYQCLRKAEHILIKYTQAISFRDEIESLANNLPIHCKSNILNLNPCLKEGILVVGGRLENADLQSNRKHPIILPHSARLSFLIISHGHITTLHGGVKLTANYIRQKYWIVRSTNTIKQVIRNCVICRKNKPIMSQQIMASIPSCRVNPARPFTHCGIDLAGPYSLKASRLRSRITLKGYVAVYVCMSTKAVFLDLVGDMTSAAFLASLRRMSARRGTPQHIYSDNGTNFVGANNVLKKDFQSFKTFTSVDFFQGIETMEIQWHFNAPAWPSAGGIWEAAVKSCKHHLRRVIGEQCLTYEEFSTVLAQVEACLNSRPLCALTDDPEEVDALTPGHFLVGSAILAPPEGVIINHPHTRWQLTQKINNDFWRKWSREYLTQLQTRTKWRKELPDIQVGNLVTIQDEFLPPTKWALGRVQALYPGNDGHVRVVSLKTQTGLIKRPISKVSVLPIHDQNSQFSIQNQAAISPSQDVKTAVILSSIPQSNSKQSQSRFKTKMKSSSFTLFNLFLILMLALASEVKAYNYSITPFKMNYGIYFEELGNIHHINDHWKIITYYNMSSYWQAGSCLEKYIESLNSVCKRLSKESKCEIIANQLNHELSEFQYYNELLTSKNKSSLIIRQKRGLINGIGYLANTLFGVLDDRFAEQYHKDIDAIKTSENYMFSLWKNQTSIIESEFNLLKRNEDIMNRQFKLINSHINEMDQSIILLNSEMEHIGANTYFLNSAVSANIFISSLRRIQQDLINTVTDLYHGRVNAHLLPPKQLLQELNIISSQLPKRLSLPVINFDIDISYIYKLLKVKTSVSNMYLIMEFKLPLLDNKKFSLYHVITYPYHCKHCTLENKFQIINTVEYLAINLEYDRYIEMSKSNLLGCSPGQHSSLFCDSDRLEYNLKHESSSCEAEVISNQNLKNCRPVTTECHDQWIKLHRDNTFLRACCQECIISIICDEHVHVTYINNTAIVSIGPGCAIKTPELTVQYHQTFTNRWSLEPDIYTPIISEINYAVNISIQHLSLLPEVNQTLENSIENDIKNIKKSEFDHAVLPQSDGHLYYISYSTVAVVVIIILILLRRYVRQCKAATPPPPPQSRAVARTDDMELVQIRNLRSSDGVVSSDSVMSGHNDTNHLYVIRNKAFDFHE